MYIYIYIYIYAYTLYVCMYIYIYIERERERDLYYPLRDAPRRSKKQVHKGEKCRVCRTAKTLRRRDANLGMEVFGAPNQGGGERLMLDCRAKARVK